jgi:hypothetical protein
MLRSLLQIVERWHVGASPRQPTPAPG